MRFSKFYTKLTQAFKKTHSSFKKFISPTLFKTNWIFSLEKWTLKIRKLLLWRSHKNRDKTIFQLKINFKILLKEVFKFFTRKNVSTHFYNDQFLQHGSLKKNYNWSIKAWRCNRFYCVDINICVRIFKLNGSRFMRRQQWWNL